MADEKTKMFEKREHMLTDNAVWEPVGEADMRRMLSECFEDVERCLDWLDGGGLVTTRKTMFRLVVDLPERKEK